MANDRTIEQFGEQWDRFSDTQGAFGSVDVLADLCGPLLALDELKDQRVFEVGSGNGRIARMVLESGAAHLTAVEPSGGIEVLRQNLAAYEDRLETLQVRGEEVPALGADLGFCVGVLHHIEDPTPTVRRIHDALRPGGRFVFWVYGRENNALYIAFAETLRILTRVCPDWLLSAIAHVLNAVLGVYVHLCRFLPLPLGKYMREVMAKYDRGKRYFLIFDQLNCGYAKYYTGEEARALMEGAGFVDVETYHRHGMSWTVIGRRADTETGATAC